MPTIAFRVTGQYKPANDAAVRAAVRDAFHPGVIDDDVQCPETHRIVAVRGTLTDVQSAVGGGAFTVRGSFVHKGDVGGCETGKALRMYFTQAAEESIGGRRAMIGRPSVTLAAMPSRVRNPSPARKRMAARHRNPSKPRTYAVARAGLLAALRDKGWSTQESGATAHATLHHPTDASRDFRVWFGSDGDARSGSGGAVDHYRRATSMHLGDISMISVDHFLEFVDVLVETDRIRRTRQDVGAMRRRHSNPAPRRRNPASKPRTYAIARAQIINALRADGWDVRENLKVPHATHPSGEFRLWFKTQAIYYTTGDRRRGQGSLSDAHSLWIGDIRAMPVAEVLADIERSRAMEARGR